jgi:hypothetical protein
VLSFMQSAPPVVWFLISSEDIAYLLHQTGSLTRLRGSALVALLLGLSIRHTGFFSVQSDGRHIIWWCTTLRLAPSV